MKSGVRFVSAVLLLMGLYGCGGESDQAFIPEGKAVLSFTAISTARLPVAVSGIDFTITLPRGMSVTTDKVVPGRIDAESIMPEGLTGLAYGSYSSSTRTAHLSMVTASNTFRGGEFMRMICNVSPNTVTYENLKALNTPVLKVIGFDLLTNSTVAMTDKMKVSMVLLP